MEELEGDKPIRGLLNGWIKFGSVSAFEVGSHALVHLLDVRIDTWLVPAGDCLKVFSTSSSSSVSPTQQL